MADCSNRVKGTRRPRARGLKHPRSALVRVHPQRVKLVNVSNEGADGMEHDEAVKMVNFSRTKKPATAKCDLDKNPRESLLVPGSWSPGSTCKLTSFTRYYYYYPVILHVLITKRL